MALICDTGPLYALMDRDDDDHDVCTQLLERPTERLVIPAPVVVEVEWLTSARLGAKAVDQFLGAVEAGEFDVEELGSRDYARIRTLCRTYADLGLGLVDASVVAVAERLGESRIVTLDRRHFGVVRPQHGGAFELLPSEAGP